MLRLSIMLVIVGTVAGCAVTSVDGRRMGIRSDAFADYVEAVFRRQNEAATALGFVLDGEQPGSERYRALEAAELNLLTACRGLNELASAARAGESGRGPGSLRRARQAPACEQATAAAEQSLGSEPGSDPDF
jgi:hypothetical protein